MALKIRFKRPEGWKAWVSLLLLVFGSLVVLAVLTGFGIFSYYYFKYQGVVDERLKQPLFANTAKIYAAPREVRPAQKLTARLIANELRSAGYSTDGTNPPSLLGTFSEGERSITVNPGPQSYHSQDGATIHLSASGVVQSITDDHGQGLSSYELEPLLITGLSDDAHRTKRRLVTYDEIPANLVQAVLAIEDRRFFEHSGVNYFRLMEAVYRDVSTGRKQQGGSTLTMQLARGFFLTPEKRIKRKIIEIVITFQLEHTFNKKKIFELYANEIPLGQQGSFSINGVGEASQVYFGKDVSKLDLAQCAFLAGIIQRPSYFNPWHHPDRTIERRNLVLDSMVETGAVTKDLAERAKAEPLHLTETTVDANEAPYFVDLVHERLLQKLGDRDFNREGLHIYTSLDPDLQQIATAAVNTIGPTIDAQIDKVHLKDKKAGKPYPYPQVALVALNPHTGQVLALVGGRSYGSSQLDHAVANRPSGSIFKPFVYASAFQTTAEGTMLPGQTQLFSPVTMLSDEQQTYDEGTDNEYTPRNFGSEFYGSMTARLALMRSDNNATIGLASMVGFDRVATPASSPRAARRPWPSAPTAPPRSRWPARTPSSPMAACALTPGCWPACARRTATSSPTTRRLQSRFWTRVSPFSPPA
jgi:penicillin-binding protein 1B